MFIHLCKQTLMYFVASGAEKMRTVPYLFLLCFRSAKYLFFFAKPTGVKKTKVAIARCRKPIEKALLTELRHQVQLTTINTILPGKRQYSSRCILNYHTACISVLHVPVTYPSSSYKVSLAHSSL